MWPSFCCNSVFSEIEMLHHWVWSVGPEISPISPRQVAALGSGYCILQVMGPWRDMARSCVFATSTENTEKNILYVPPIRHILSLWNHTWN